MYDPDVMWGSVFSCLDGKVGFGTLFILNTNIPDGICMSSLMNSQPV